ncbi:MAG: hypothetical protein ACREAA_20755 [Candidatus Polarisedimenticolia bacterium]
MKEVKTREYLHRRLLGPHELGDAVQWALGQAEIGPVTPSLAALCLLSPPFNSHEIEALVTEAFRELGVAQLPRAEVIRDFVRWGFERLASGEFDAPQLCRTLGKRFAFDNETRLLFDFYTLDCDHESLQNGENPFHHPGTTIENFSDTVLHVGRRLLGREFPESGLTTP